MQQIMSLTVVQGYRPASFKRSHNIEPGRALKIAEVSVHGAETSALPRGVKSR
jgi:hypothetical protein